GRFFPRRPAGTGPADALGGPVAQLGVEFLPAAADGIDVQAGDLRQQGVAAVADVLGLQGGQPAALLLVQAAHQQVDVVVQGPRGVVLPREAGGTGTAVDDRIDHDSSSLSRANRTRRIVSETWKSFVDNSLASPPGELVRLP